MVKILGFGPKDVSSILALATKEVLWFSGRITHCLCEGREFDSPQYRIEGRGRSRASLEFGERLKTVSWVAITQ